MTEDFWGLFQILGTPIAFCKTIFKRHEHFWLSLVIQSHC